MQRYAIAGEKVRLFGNELTPYWIGEAAEAIESIDPLYEIIVRPAPTAGDILGVELKTYEVQELLEFGLTAMMRELGVTEDQIQQIQPYGEMC